MRVLITGGSGFIGRALQGRLRGRGDLEVLAPTRAELDLADEQAALAWLERARPDAVVHLAAATAGAQLMRSAPTRYFRANVAPAFALATAAEAGLIGRIVLPHSAGAYPRPGSLTPPRSSLRPQDLWAGAPAGAGYGLARRAVGGLLREACGRGGVAYVELTLPTVYGPGDGGVVVAAERLRAVPAFALRTLAALAAGAPLVSHFGSGTEVRDFLHVDDAAAALLAAIDADVVGRHLHVSDGVARPLATVADTICAAAGFTGEVVWSAPPPPPEARDVVVLEPAGLDELGVRPAVPFAVGVAGVVAELRLRLGAHASAGAAVDQGRG